MSKASLGIERRRREIALIEANVYMELVDQLEKRDAPKPVQREMLATIKRKLWVAEGKEVTDGDFHRAVVKRSMMQPGAARAEGQPAAGVLSGYAAKFGSRSLDLGGYTEEIAPGAFTRSLAAGKDIKMLFDHESSLVLASVAGGSLKVWEDRAGLAFEADLGRARQFANDAAETIRRGDVRGMSFGFYPIDDEWREEGARIVRTLRDVDLFEISAVSFPAYPAAGVSARGVKSGRSSQPAAPDWQRKAAQRRRELDLLILA